MTAAERLIDVEDLKNRIRAGVAQRNGLSRPRFNPDSEVAALPSERRFSDVLQFHLAAKTEPKPERLQELLEKARDKIEVPRWVPKLLHRFFRKQGGFNKLLLESIRLLIRLQRNLGKENSELRAYLQAHYYWLADFTKGGEQERNQIRSLRNDSFSRDQELLQIRTRLDRHDQRWEDHREFVRSMRREVGHLQSQQCLINESGEQIREQTRQIEERLAKSERNQTQVREQVGRFLENVETLSARLDELRILSTRLDEVRLENQTANAGLVELVEGLQKQIQSLSADATQFKAQLQELAVTGATAQADVAKNHSAVLELSKTFDDLARKSDERTQSYSTFDSRLEALSAELNGLRASADRLEERWISDTAYFKGELSLQQEIVYNRLQSQPQKTAKRQLKGATVPGQDSGRRFDAFYLAFENHFRGTRSEIKSRFAYYLPYLDGLKSPKKSLRFLDVGCGRGEWMELLKEHGYTKATGVDSNRAMADQCRERGFQVAVEDAVDHLAGLKKGSLDVITGFHVIEHLPFERLMSLLSECYRLLRAGGMIIFETPNPDNLIVAAKNFYTDPTHINPLPSVLTSFLAEHAGFINVQIAKQHPFTPEVLLREKGEVSARFNELFYSEQDYAVIATKR
jgi:SAM-dependent methyltransferase